MRSLSSAAAGLVAGAVILLAAVGCSAGEAGTQAGGTVLRVTERDFRISAPKRTRSGAVPLSVSATKRSQHRASVLEVAARQRTLAERYVVEVLLARAGAQADPTYTAGLLVRSATALLDGGKAPSVNGDDDETTLPAASGSIVRAQLQQEGRLVDDLTATGSA